MRRAAYLGQAVATVAVLAAVPGNGWKLAALLALWAATFWPLAAREIVCYIATCALFSVMDIMAVRQGAFAFSRPDFAGLPMWEFFIWGFYVLHVLRMLGGPRPASRARTVAPLAVVFALPFVVPAQPWALLALSAIALALVLAFFHDRWDLFYAGYTLLLGAAIEYAGVWSGQWHYPGNPPGGVAFWFATMWAGIGLFIRHVAYRLAAPGSLGADLRSSHAVG